MVGELTIKGKNGRLDGVEQREASWKQEDSRKEAKLKRENPQLSIGGQQPEGKRGWRRQATG